MNPRDYYPTEGQADEWAEGIYRLGLTGACGEEKDPWAKRERYPRLSNLPQTEYMKFHTSYSADFYALWQPARKTPAPLVIHVPGYGAEMSVFPALVDRGYNVLHICPLGYFTPDGRDESKLGSRPGQLPIPLW